MYQNASEEDAYFKWLLIVVPKDRVSAPNSSSEWKLHSQPAQSRELSNVFVSMLVITWLPFMHGWDIDVWEIPLSRLGFRISGWRRNCTKILRRKQQALLSSQRECNCPPTYVVSQSRNAFLLPSAVVAIELIFKNILLQCLFSFLFLS